MKKVLLLAIGDELLSGIRRDTNCAGSAWLFHNAGWKVSEIEVVPDVQEIIIETLNRWVGKVDLIIISGGLGPTHDDRTRFAVADYLGCELEIDHKSYDVISARYVSPIREWIERSRPMQGLIPTKAKAVNNPTGSALGIFFEQAGTRVYCFPGVPTEYSSMVDQEFGDILKPSGGWTSIAIVGVPESAVKEYLSEIIADESFHISILPSFGTVEFVIRGDPQKIEQAEDKVRSILQDDCMPHGILKLPDAILYEAQKKNLKVAFAESCTGGMIGAALTDVPGISKSFAGSCVVYDNKAKSAVLGVKQETLNTYGAVSSECATEMAEGARKIYGSDYAVAVTGIAGPEGGSAQKPVGTVWFAISGKNGTRAFLRNLNGNRTMIRERAKTISLETMWRELKEGRE